MAAILNFRFFAKMTKHKFASLSLSVRDRAISSKFSTHRVSTKCTLGNFQKIFPSPKMVAILNFRIFAKSIYCCFLSISQCSVIVIRPFLCQLTCQSADIMSSLCGVGVRVRFRVNNFSSKTTRPRDVLFFLKDTLSIEDEKLFKACKSVCWSVC